MSLLKPEKIQMVVPDLSKEKQYCNHQAVQPNSNIAKYAIYLKSLYAARNMPVCQKWPPTPSKRYINLALIGKDDAKLTEAYELTTAKLHGHIDKILKKKVPIQLHEILSSSENQKCILIEGAPGVGKTTLAWELCRNWVQFSMLQNYSLVLLIHLREKRVQQADTFGDLLYHRNTSLKQATAKDVEDSDGDNILLILDGFDELPSDQRQLQSLFLDIINGLYLPRATIIITSRPSVTAELLTKCKPQITKHIEILGFTENDIQEYVFSIFQHIEQVEKFYECVMSNPLIYSMMYIPLNSAIVVEIYRQGQDMNTPFPQTMTQLYDKLAHALVRRYLIENGLVTDEFQMPRDLRCLPHETSHHIVELCAVAFSGLCNEQQIWTDLPNNFHHLGFMSKSSSLLVDKGPEIHFSFLHLTVQEFLAAVHISYQTACKQRELYYMYGPMKHFQVVWRFLAGLTKFVSLSWSDVLHRNLTAAPDWLQVDHCLQLPALHYLYEAQEPRIFQEFHGSTKVFGFLPDSASAFDCLALSYCVSNTVCTWVIDLINAGVNYQCIRTFTSSLKSRAGSIRELRIGSNQMGLEGINSLSIIPPAVMATINSLKLYNCSLDTAAFEKLAELLISFSNLEQLDLGSNPVCSGGMVQVMHSLQHLSDLNLLDIADVAIGSDDIQALAELLQHIRLKTLKIGHQSMTEDIAALLLQVTFHPSTIECIDLRNVDFTPIATSLEQLLRENCNIRTLTLTWCRLGPIVARSIAQALCVNNSLQSLKIKHPTYGIQPDGCSSFCKMLLINRTLCELVVLDEFLGETVQELISTANSSTSLNKWQFGQ